MLGYVEQQPILSKNSTAFGQYKKLVQVLYTSTYKNIYFTLDARKAHLRTRTDP